MKNKKKVVVFGGAFNPPHLAHYEIMKDAMGFVQADMGVFVPVNDRYNKNDLVHSAHRIAMLDLMKDETMLVSDIEVKSEEVLSTYRTLRYLKEEFDGAELYFLMGLDNLQQFTLWERWDNILENNYLLVMKRNGLNVKEVISAKDELRKYAHKIVEIDLDVERNVSSTGIRNMVRRGDKNAQKYLNRDVCSYIKNEKLYL